MARDFPGSASNYLNVGDVAAIDITGTALTVACWAKPDTVTGLHFLFAKGVDTTNVQYTVYQNGNAFNAEVGDSGGNDNSSSSSQFSIGTWGHYAARKNGTGAGALATFVNGLSVNSVTSNRSIQNTANSLFIGQRSDNNAITAFDGLVAEVAIWDVALTDAEMFALGAGVNPVSLRYPNLKGYWPLCGYTLPEPDLVNANNASQVGTVNTGTHPYAGYCDATRVSGQSQYAPHELGFGLA